MILTYSQKNGILSLVNASGVTHFSTLADLEAKSRCKSWASHNNFIILAK